MISRAQAVEPRTTRGRSDEGEPGFRGDEGTEWPSDQGCVRWPSANGVAGLTNRFHLGPISGLSPWQKIGTWMSGSETKPAKAFVRERERWWEETSAWHQADSPHQHRGGPCHQTGRPVNRSGAASGIVPCRSTSSLHSYSGTHGQEWHRAALWSQLFPSAHAIGLFFSCSLAMLPVM